MGPLIFFLLIHESLWALPQSLQGPAHSDSAALQAIGKQIWHNECSGSVAGLTSWNEGEEFASLGLGHFIWYPATAKQRPFQETFPALIVFLQQRAIKIPLWLQGNCHCPWNTRQEFLNAIESPQMNELRALLCDTLNFQVEFIVSNLQSAIHRLDGASICHQKALKEQFFRVYHSPGGLYALIDYVNFKGEGNKPSESYQGHRWGLHQVLLEMHVDPSTDPIADFVRCAKKVLENRVANAPPHRCEQRWLPGWHNRLDTYLHR